MTWLLGWDSRRACIPTVSLARKTVAPGGGILGRHRETIDEGGGIRGCAIEEGFSYFSAFSLVFFSISLGFRD